jgi:hypothetical protein
MHVHYTEPASDIVKFRVPRKQRFLDHLSNYQVLKEDPELRSEEISSLLLNPKNHRRVHKREPLEPILRKINQSTLSHPIFKDLF